MRRTSLIAWLSTSTAALVLFVLLFLLPSYRSYSTADHSLRLRQSDLKRVDALMPLYVELIQKKAAKLAARLPVPAVEPLDPVTTPQMPALFRGKAEKAGVVFVRATPELRAFTERYDLLKVEIVVQGDMRGFRAFLVELGGTACLDSIESLEVKRVDAQEVLRIETWLAVASPTGRKPGGT